MTIVYFAAIIAGILYGIAESITKNITEKKYSAFSYAFLQWSLNAVFYLVPFIFFWSFPTTFAAYIYFSGVLLTQIIGNVVLIKAYKTEDISIITILSRSSLVIAFLCGVFLLQEKITLLNSLGIISIIIGIIVIFYERKRLQLSPGYLFAILSGVFYGLVAYFEKMALGYFDIVSFIFLFNLSAAIILWFIPGTRRDIKPIFVKYKKQFLLTRICIVTGVFLLLWSLRSGNLSIVNTNAETSFLLSTAFIGIIFLNEKKNILKKLAGSLLCVLGIILLNFF